MVLACTEHPLLVTPQDSPLPTLDSTRLLARAAVDYAMRGWKKKGQERAPLAFVYRT